MNTFITKLLKDHNIKVTENPHGEFVDTVEMSTFQLHEFCEAYHAEKLESPKG